MLRQSTWGRVLAPACVAAALALAVTACGEDAKSDDGARSDRAAKECRAQWADVGESVVGLDEDPDPSALADRWNSVIATVEYYRTSGSAKGCHTGIEAQQKAITALRQFSEKLRPYDMTYQLAQVRASIDLYLNDPLPDPARDENHTLVRPPTKAAVSSAMQTLTADAATANAELEPAWEQTNSVDLSDVAALTKAMQDLDLLAQDSPHWRGCEEALQVLVSAIRFQEGLVGSTSSGPSASPTDATTPPG